MKRAILTAAATLSIGLLSFGLAATSASAQETKCEPDKLATKYPSLVGKTINLAQDGESPPFSFRDPKDFDHIVGMDTELAEAVFKCAGVPIKIVTAGWSGLLPSVISGQTDVMWDILYYTPERAKKVDFVTYMVAATGALVAKGNPQNIHSMADACGKRATAGLATVEEAAFRDQAAKCIAAGKPDISIVTYPDIPGGTRLIQNDRADVMLSGLSVVNALVAQNPNAFELGYTIVTDYKVSAAVTRGNKDLAKLIYDGLKIAMADGSYKTIIEKYGFSMSLALKPEILTQ
ncbi:MAG TPA: ABC transporter substrate-binding protein [Rhizomicrobium sp.]|nr:ABC transporter substrate-binding protein [Rhizomicrobium sp.]